jgi:hypothetical protein
MSDGAKTTLSIVKKLSAMVASPFSNHTPPKGLSNFETSVWVDQQRAAEVFMVTGIGKSFFEKAYKAAKAECERLKLWSEDDLLKLSPGVTHTIFHGQFVSITCKPNNAGTKLDTEAFKIELAKLGVKPEIIAKAEKASIVETTAAKRIEAAAL